MPSIMRGYCIGKVYAPCLGELNDGIQDILNNEDWNGAKLKGSKNESPVSRPTKGPDVVPPIDFVRHQ
jgi:hypothetical protein